MKRSKMSLKDILLIILEIAIKTPVYLLIVLFFFGCDVCKNNYVLSEKEVLSNLVLNKVATKLHKEHNLVAIGTGGGMMNQIRMLALSFEYCRPIRPWEGRKLLMSAIHTFLSEINSDEKIRPYLIHYPFLPEDIQIHIFLRNSDRSAITFGELNIISSLKGIFEYDIRDPQTTRLTTVYKETYAEALNQIACHSTEPHTLYHKGSNKL